jgi:sulfite exporter TauE/SafE
MALVLHSFKAFFEPRVQQYVSIALGLILVLVGILSFLPNSKLKIALPWTSFIKKYIGKFIGNPSPGALLVAGVMNGLLPCGLVYMALSAAVVSNTTGDAILAMYAFGIGTMPMLIGITVLKSKATFFRFGHAKKLVPVAMFVFGCLFVLRGMNLGVPYLSPKVEVTQQHEVKASCCHKK